VTRHVFVSALLAAAPLCAAAAEQVAPSPPPPPDTVVAPGPPAPPVAASPPPARWVADDKRRTMRSYGRNLAYNFLGVVTPGNHEPLAVTALLAAPAFAWDDEAIDYFRKHPHRNFGRIGAKLGGGIAVAGLSLGAFSAGRFSHVDRFRATTYDISQAIIVNQVWTQALKLAIRRDRPDGSNRQSFPSGHASNAFTAATAIALHYPRLAVPGYAVATYIATSRLAANKHHVSDIVAGAGFGYGVGRLVVRRNGRPPEAGAVDTSPRSTRHLQVVPYGGPAGDGFGLAVHAVF
jgi:membrane-associated phospholipid phosphatase